jgi:hypothetical protein
MAKSRIARIGDKLYDLGTMNKSFLQVAKDLQTVGIKNCYFLLEIYDYSLVNIDPFSVGPDGHTNLTQDQITRIMTECMRNPWYYLREISRIPDPGGTAVPYKANRGNIAQAWCILHGLDSWLNLTRQQGKTQSALALESWMYSFGTSQSQFIYINKSGEDSKTNLKRTSDQIRFLPEYLRFESFTDADGKVTKATNNATKMGHPINGNTIITKPKATSYDSALSLARGLTSPIQHFDEAEFTPHIKTIVANSVSTYETAAARAEANGAMHARIFTSTPGDLDSAPGREAQEILDKTAKWTERIYDMTKEEIQDYLDSQGKDCNKILYIEYQYYQIGLTEEWLKNISAKIGDPMTVRREILLQRLHGSSLSPFSQEDIQYLIEIAHKPIDELWLLDYYRFDIYKKLNPRIPYIIGVDCSTGTGGDNNAITILNPYTVEPEAEFECSYIGETKFEELLISLIDVLPRGVLCIERNSVGDSIIDHLLNSKIRSHLYYDKAKDLVEEKSIESSTIESMLKKQAAIKTYYGVYTDKKSREDMIAILTRHVNEFKEKFVTQNITRDISRLIKTSSGKVEAGPGWHDDSIMSYLMCLYVYYHGNNLPVFGIIKGSVQTEEMNKGMKRASEIDPSLVDPRLIESVKKQEQQIIEQKQWESMMKEAAIRAQRDTYRLTKAGEIQNSIFNNTPGEVMEEIDDNNSGNIDLSFFNSINGF